MREQTCKTFNLKCRIDSQGMLSINIPQKLQSEFECKVKRNDMQILCEIFDEFSKLPHSLRRRFQNRIFAESKNIEKLEEVLFLLWDTKLAQ